jgi:hypothetical protein
VRAAFGDAGHPNFALRIRHCGCWLVNLQPGGRR